MHKIASLFELLSKKSLNEIPLFDLKKSSSNFMQGIRRTLRMRSIKQIKQNFRHLQILEEMVQTLECLLSFILSENSL